ncbi:lecithin retinol acyltransferase a [Lampris incognitus]|uniref:lecithin retinol acyltransferase a n=1 Tax=Lampris incognitus TaxID=2546036 RepID=UPI0024B5BF66|nr:lecithin retinol acyltransferase a [Lampris incognitus]
MFHLLTFLVEKLSLLSNLQLFEPRWSPGEQRGEPKTRLPASSFRRGDLLEVPRTLFTHFGVYLGDDRVAHLIPDILPVLTSNRELIDAAITNKRLILGCIYRRATVRVDTVEDFAYGSSITANRMDELVQRQALPNEDVAKRAEKLIGAIPYSLLWNNCEHFVTHCRYGSAASQQTEQFCDGLKSLIRDQRSIIAAVLLGVVSISWFGMVPLTTLPTILIPFTLWMAG